MAVKKRPVSNAPQDDYVFLVSADLVQHEHFLHDFIPTGNTERDLWAFFSGVGHSELADLTVETGGTLVELALGIISNHRNEMDRIDRGERIRWGEYQRWEPEQKRLYRHLMAMEEAILTSIILGSGMKEPYEAPRLGS